VEFADDDLGCLPRRRTGPGAHSGGCGENTHRGVVTRVALPMTSSPDGSGR
jgi:hypothetical protein